MARMTETELSIQDVIDRWMREDFGGRVLIKHSPEYGSLVSAIDAFIRKKEQVDAVKFQKAVELAYERGHRAGLRLKE
jgi:hypothetical protein